MNWKYFKAGVINHCHNLRQHKREIRGQKIKITYIKKLESTFRNCSILKESKNLKKILKYFNLY